MDSRQRRALVEATHTTWDQLVAAAVAAVPQHLAAGEARAGYVCSLQGRAQHGYRMCGALLLVHGPCVHPCTAARLCISARVKQQPGMGSQAAVWHDVWPASCQQGALPASKPTAVEASPALHRPRCCMQATTGWCMARCCAYKPG